MTGKGDRLLFSTFCNPSPRSSLWPIVDSRLARMKADNMNVVSLNQRPLPAGDELHS